MLPLSPTRRVLLAVGVLFSVGVITSGVLSTIGWLARSSYEQDTVISPLGQRLSVRDGGGQVELSASTDGQVHVHARVRYGIFRPTLTQTSTSDGVQLVARCPGGFGFNNCQVDYTIAAPPASAVDVVSGGGDIRVRDLTGTASLSTGGGNIEVSGSGGRLTLTTGGGNIASSGLRSAEVTARTGGGNVTLVFVAAPVTVSAESGGGNIEVAVPNRLAYRVDAGSGGGDATIGIPTDPQATRSIYAHSGGGNVDVHATTG